MQTWILVGLFVCHWLADYTPLSRPWMLGAKSLGRPLFPIFVHAAVHSSLMGLFLAFMIGIVGTLPLIGVQLATHFLIDLLKGRLNGFFPALQSPADRRYWVLLGFDQLLHSLVIVWMSAYAAI